MAAPTITTIIPKIGYLPGGRNVTIAGTNLDTATAVTFGATAGTIVSQAATSMVVTTPAKTSSGAVDVVVTNPDGTATSAGGFTLFDDWLGGSLEAVENLLCNCATFKTLMGVSTAATAKDKCYWQVRRGAVTAPYAHLLALEGGSFSERGKQEFEHSDSIAVRIVWTELSSTNDTEKDICTRNVNAFGKLMGEITALIGTSTYLIRAVSSYDPPEPMPDDDPDLRGSWDAVLTFSWSI